MIYIATVNGVTLSVSGLCDNSVGKTPCVELRTTENFWKSHIGSKEG